MNSALGRAVNVDHSGNTIDIIENPPNLTYTFVRSDIGSASWEVPLSHERLHRASSADSDSVLSGIQPGGFGPKLTDYHVGISRNNGNSWQTKHAGICGPVGLDAKRSSVAVSGQDWLAWLEQPYKFAAYSSVTLDDVHEIADVVTLWTGANQQTILTGLVNHLDVAGLNIVPLFEGNWNDTALPFFSVIYGDTTNILSLIKNVGAYNNPYGFEFRMDWDKKLTFSAPRRTPPEAAESGSIYDFEASGINEEGINIEGNIIDIKWTNNGPRCSTLIGEQNGLRYLSDAPKVAAVYRDWWSTEGFSTTKKKDLATPIQMLKKKTEFLGNFYRSPQRALTMTIQPEITTSPDWFSNLVGKVIHVYSGEWFLPYWRINGYFWIDQQTLKSDDVGNWTCDLVLEQVYS